MFDGAGARSPTASTSARLWIVARGRRPARRVTATSRSPPQGRAAVDAAYAAGARARAAAATAPPGPRPQYGPRYYAAYLLDPDGLRVEVVSGAH